MICLHSCLPLSHCSIPRKELVPSKSRKTTHVLVPSIVCLKTLRQTACHPKSAHPIFKEAREFLRSLAASWMGLGVSGSGQAGRWGWGESEISCPDPLHEQQIHEPLRPWSCPRNSYLNNMLQEIKFYSHVMVSHYVPSRVGVCHSN